MDTVVPACQASMNAMLPTDVDEIEITSHSCCKAERFTLCDNPYLHISAHMERLLLLDQWVHIHHVRHLCKAVITHDKRQVHPSFVASVIKLAANFVDGYIHDFLFCLQRSWSCIGR